MPPTGDEKQIVVYKDPENPKNVFPKQPTSGRRGKKSDEDETQRHEEDELENEGVEEELPSKWLFRLRIMAHVTLVATKKKSTVETDLSKSELP